MLEPLALDRKQWVCFLTLCLFAKLMINELVSEKSPILLDSLASFGNF